MRNINNNDNKTFVRILSIDGGGVRGIIAAIILMYLEKQIQQITNNVNAKIGEYFDLFAGTSTGGLLSLLYTCPDKSGTKFKYNAKQVVEIYLKNGQKLFQVSLRKKIMSLGGILDEKYDRKYLESVIENYIDNNTKIYNALKPLLITSYDIENRKVKMFTSENNEDNNYTMKQVACATSAAPTYFEPVHIDSINKNMTLIDGGVFANNPSMCAYAQARTMNFKNKADKPCIKDMLIVSIGTGKITQPYTYENFKDAGVLNWIKPLIDIMINANSETVHYQLQQIYNTLLHPKQQKQPQELNYYRIQTELNHSDIDLDNVTKENINNLVLDAITTIKKYKTTLKNIAQKLIDNQSITTTINV